MANSESDPQLPAPGGFNQALNLKFLSADANEVVAELPISPQHHQPMGIVHGGVYCAMVETVCSVGGHLASGGMMVVGVDNHTSFLKAQRAGTLRATARALVRGRRTQLWEANIVNLEGELVATGRVRLICIEPGAKLAGEAAAMK
ncbi:MAG: PaaI family thioesterase [Myxococcales bacterium]